MNLKQFFTNLINFYRCAINLLMVVYQELKCASLRLPIWLFDM